MLFGREKIHHEVLNRNNEAERKRNTENTGLVLDWLFPPGGPSQRKNTGVGQMIASVKQRLKENPTMTKAMASLITLAAGASGMMYMYNRNPSRSRRRRKTKRKRIRKTPRRKFL